MANYFWRLRKRGTQHGKIWHMFVEHNDRMKFPQLFGIQELWITLRGGKPCIESEELLEAA